MPARLCSTKSGRRSCSPIRNPAPLAGRSPTQRPRSRQGDHRRRAERAAGRTTSMFKGAPDWFADAAATEDLRARRRAAHLRSAADRRAQLAFVRAGQAGSTAIWCAAGAQARAGAQAGESRRPFRSLIVSSEASYHASYDHCTARISAQAGVKNTLRAPRRSRHPRQWSHDDAGKEQ